MERVVQTNCEMHDCDCPWQIHNEGEMSKDLVLHKYQGTPLHPANELGNVCVPLQGNYLLSLNEIS